ncbi:Toll/interleukin-1 receptor homology (TIR) domain superfamily [Arabidopsis suecica]|uniref:ADP-ribosyl cyclase/cyclic ADP-ribose hydrolase n=1 Tax=Arabidopsis suecica TaxID=45249 RepID=A0A8T2BNB5_ARASU|nr:Toll/interleukin-1 receptor homology (TIR) domain superfamily [Arabidopsis suecica]
MDSSSLSLPSSFSRNWKHHVFLSFHGADVRKAFLSHILKEFRSKGIDPFIDNDIERSKSIGPELIEAIRGSRIAIVLLSRNYASSSWCLDELVEIMRGRDELGQIVITIFYDVDPTNVKKQTKEFGEVFKNTCAGKTEEVTRTWRHALAKVATIAGYDLSNWNNEATMIEKITSDISNKLNHSTPSCDFDGFVGIKGHFEKMKPLLCLESNEVRMIGIWGPSGIGKTTIARFLLDQLSHQFRLSTIVMNIKVSYPRPCHDEHSANVKLQKQLLSQLFNEKDIEIPHLGVVRERLKDKKVLVILDDVDQLRQLQAMANEPRWFGPGSRIIITTQNIRNLKGHGINHIYKVDFPSTHEAFQIFCMNAFGQKLPYAGFEELAWEITKLSGELPLGLRVMGSYLRRMSKEEWTRVLPTLMTRLNGEIESILMISYDALCDEDKDLFLYIACFFNYYNMEMMVEYFPDVRQGLDVTQGLHVLAEKSLISVDDSGTIYMHDLLAKLGREIVRKQFVSEPGLRKFLVDPRDICDVLTDDTGSRNVLGIDLQVFELEDELEISERAFDGMSNLQFLRFSDNFISHDKLCLPQGLNCLSRKLRLLHWIHFPMTCLPSKFATQFLVELNMQCSKLETLWEGIRPLRKLKRMNLSYSKNLIELPDLSTATNLQELFLYYCSSLVELPSTITHATNLERLDLIGCSSLRELPSFIGNVTNLMHLDLSGCSSLVELPSSIRDATCMRLLAVSECKRLVSIPQLPIFLGRLEAEKCESMETLDFSLHNPEISLNFASCFKLNKEARDLICQTSLIHGVAILPGEEVPACFTYRASGDSVTVKLNDIPLPTTLKFKACILLVYKGDDDEAGVGEMIEISSHIIEKHNGNIVTCRPDDNLLYPPITKHLYIFEVQAEEVTSSEFVVEFRVDSWEIVECGVFQVSNPFKLLLG